MIQQSPQTFTLYEQYIKNETALFLKPRQKSTYLRTLYRKATHANKKRVITVTLFYFPHLATVLKAKTFLLTKKAIKKPRVKKLTQTITPHEEHLRHEIATITKPRNKSRHLRQVYKQATKFFKTRIINITLEQFPHLLTTIATRKFLARAPQKGPLINNPTLC